jgi:DEAD/DEAH box helicase domain-containing protein
VDQATLDRNFNSRQDALDGFLGAAYAIHTAASVHVMADARDLQKSVGSGDAAFYATQDQHGRGQWRNAQGAVQDPDRSAAFNPTVYLYDNYPGGIGLSEPLFRCAAALVASAAALVRACECKLGCPGCVGPVLAPDESTQRSSKALALCVLGLLS